MGSLAPPVIQSIRPTAAEREAGHLAPRNLKTILEALHEDGIAVIEDVVDHGHLDKLNERMTKDAFFLRDMENPPFQQNPGNIQQDPPPEPELFFEDIYFNKLAIHATSAYLGGRPQMTFISGNTAVYGTESQAVHMDARPDHPKIPYGVVLNIGLIEMNPQNGSTELWLGTHTIDRTSETEPTNKVPPAVLEARKKAAPEKGPFQPTVPKGAIVIRDMRLWHCGKPNRTQTPRVMTAQIHWAEWYRNRMTIEFPKGMEKMLNRPEIEISAKFVDGPVDYLHHGNGPSRFDFTPGN